MIEDLKSERVILREVEKRDWIDVHKYASQEKVCRYQTWDLTPNKNQRTLLSRLY